MALIGFQLEDVSEARLFINATIERSKREDFSKNPFRCESIVRSNGDNLIFIQHIKPLYPKIYEFGIWMMLLGFFIQAIWPRIGFGFVVGGLLMSLQYIFFSSFFYSVMFKFGLKKVKYDGSIIVLDVDDIMTRVMALVPE